MKLTTPLLLLFCITCTFSFSQNKGWEIGTGLSLGNTVQLCSQDGFKTSDNPTILHFSTDVFARKFFKNRFGFEFGLQVSYFSLKRYKYEYTVYPDGSSGYPFYMNKRDYLFGEIPLRFMYKHSIKKFDVGAIVGLTPAALIVAAETRSDNSGLTSTISKTYLTYSNTNPINLFADVGFLFLVNVYRRLYFEAKPMMRISLISMDKQDNGNSYVQQILNAGTQLGVTWKL